MLRTGSGKLNFRRDLPLLAGAGLAFATAVYFHGSFKRPEIVLSKQQSAVTVDHLFLKLFSLGHKRLIADTMWIQTLIESDIEHYKGDPLNSWMFLRFNSISQLDPLFYENYLFGGQYLSIVKDDTMGAEEIFSKGLMYYPEDYRLNFNHGFNYYYEMGNLEKGLEYLSKVQDHPKAPRFIKSLVIKLQHELENDPNSTLELLKEVKVQSKDPYLIRKLERDIYAVKAEIDLACLNAGRSNCNRIDSDGTPYRLEGGTYRSAKPFSPYRLHQQRR